MNLRTEQKERIKSGDIIHLRDILLNELDQVRDLLIDSPPSSVEVLQGKARTLKEIIKLLP